MTEARADSAQSTTTDVERSQMRPPSNAPQTTTVLKLPAVSITVSRTDAAPTADDQSRLGPLAVYGGITALGALEIVEWPVAVGLGAGVFLWRRLSRRPAAAGGPPMTASG